MESRRDRLEKYWKFKGFKNASAFSKFLDLHPDHVGKIDEKGASGKLNLRLAEKCPDLNLSWVITGEGDMLVGEDKEKPQTPDPLKALMSEVEKAFADKETLEEQYSFVAHILKSLRESKRN